MNRRIQIGDTITYQRGGVTATGAVVSIDRCPRRGDKYGVKVQSLDWDVRAYGFLKLDTGYCYGYEVV